MEVAIDRSYPTLSALAANNPQARYVGFLMEGTVPQNAAEVKARVDLTDLADVHAKCVGTIWAEEQQYNTVRESGTTIVSLWPNTLMPPQLKGGSRVYPNNTAYQMYMPDRVYRPDRKSDYGHTSPRFFSYMYHLGYESSLDTYEAFKAREATTDPTDVTFQLEYDTPRTVTAIRYGGVGTSETVSVTNVTLQYYDEATSTWKSAGTWAITAAYNLATTGTVLTLGTAVTAKLFRYIMTFPSAFVAVRRFRGCCLLGANALTPPQINPTWVILVPALWAYYGTVAQVGLPKLKTNLTEYDYVPAIIDSCGYNNGGKVSLDASFNIVCYTFALGNIK